MNRITLRRTYVSLCALAAATSLAACGGSGGSTPSTGAGSATSAEAAPSAGGSAPAGAVKLTAADTWAKAAPDIKARPMTGVFGKVTNTGDQPIVIVSGKNSLSPVTELHETVMKDGKPVMQPVQNGFTIEPGKTKEFKPGSDHIMVMKMTKPLKPGETVNITLNTKDGGTFEFSAVAKVFTMGNEPYQSAKPGASKS